MNLSRRGLISGLVALVAAPAIVRVESLMALPAHAKIILPDSSIFIQNSMGLQIGDIITFDDVYAIDRFSKLPTECLRQFVVTCDGPFAEAKIYPRIVTEGPYRTVSQRPAELHPRLWASPTTSFE